MPRKRLSISQIATVVVVTTGLIAATRMVDADDDVQFFESRVRPLLVEHCHACHGAKKQEAGLRLDSRDAVLKGSDSGQVAVAGDAKNSLLWQAATHEGDIQMPPEGKLADEAIQAIAEWIDRGLPWPEEASVAGAAPIDSSQHWSLQPIRRTQVPPSIVGDAWSRTPIDRFILAALTKQGLTPSEEAPREVLLRRLSFDLLGLPPSLAENETLLAGGSADDAYERLVDRTLASPHYGERWARHWLDVARYADNKGYVFFEENKFPWAWTYRDYVVGAWNADLPFDRFVLEQLAADQLPGATPQSLAAMGFLTVGNRFMNNLHDVIDDRIDVVTRGLLGLTVTCARCHDHKFDPISTADYYALYGVFRSSVEPLVPPALPERLADAAASEDRAAFDAELKTRVGKLEEFVAAKHGELVTSARARAAEYLLAAHAQRDQPATDDFMLIADPGDLNPTMILRWRVLLERSRREKHPVWTAWHALADLPSEDFTSRAASVIAEMRSSRAGNAFLLETLAAKPPASMAETAAAYAQVLQDVEKQWLAARTGGASASGLLDSDREALRQVFYGPSAPPDTPPALGWGFLSLLPDRAAQDEYKKLLKEVETHLMSAGAPARAMALVDEAAPYAPRIFQRGNPNRLGEEVSRRFLSRLDPQERPFTSGSGRFDLAKAIVDDANPLTARVIVNRLWMHHFGVGLAATPSDFGLRGNPPSHLELLDWLASELIDSGWSLKHLQRLIVTSAVYRQSSAGVAPATDPENRLLSRMNRRRLSFEALRDAAVAVSGDLDERLGGPPSDLFSGRFAARRSLYGFIDRLDTPGLLTTFNFPSPLASTPQRDVTTVPPQALFLMNGEFLTEAARRLSERAALHAARTPTDGINFLYETIYSRATSQNELAAGLEYLGAAPSPEEWSRFSQALLMTNEFAFVD